jgi:hypothetical protein
MIRSALLTLAGLLSLVCPIVPRLCAATAAPQSVAFLSDQYLTEWSQTSAFKAHPNWTAYPTLPQNFPYLTGGSEAVSLVNLQRIISSGQKPVIFIQTGEATSEAVSPGNQHSSLFAIWAQGWERLIVTAQQAKLPVILSTIPYSIIGDVHDMNRYILTYGIAHNIPVVNFDFAINSGTGFAAGPQPVYYLPGEPTPVNGFPAEVLTQQAYDLMTDMATVSIGTTTGAIKFKSGYLDTWVWTKNEDSQSYQSGNTNIDGGVTQFIAYAVYTDGSTHRVQNADIDGHIGTWLSSNPLVMSIDWNGVGMGGASGSTSVHFMDPQGKIYSSWTMYNDVYVFGCPNNPCAVY